MYYSAVLRQTVLLHDFCWMDVFLFLYHAGALFTVVATSFGGTISAVMAYLVALIYYAIRKIFGRKAIARKGEISAHRDQLKNVTGSGAVLKDIERQHRSSEDQLCCIPQARSGRNTVPAKLELGEKEQPEKESAKKGEECVGGLGSGRDRVTPVAQTAV